MGGYKECVGVSVGRGALDEVVVSRLVGNLVDVSSPSMVCVAVNRTVCEHIIRTCLLLGPAALELTQALCTCSQAAFSSLTDAFVVCQRAPRVRISLL